MVLRVCNITIDSRDPHSCASWWAEALGFAFDPQYPNHPSDPEVAIIDPGGHQPMLLFTALPEPKVAKNRLHLDLEPLGGRGPAVERLLRLGAQLVDDRTCPSVRAPALARTMLPLALPSERQLDSAKDAERHLWPVAKWFYCADAYWSFH